MAARAGPVAFRHRRPPNVASPPSAGIGRTVGVAPRHVVSSRAMSDLETLLEARAAVVREAAPLHARHGPGGTFAEVRENLRAELAVEYRARLADYEGRVTQAMIRASPGDRAGGVGGSGRGGRAARLT